MKIEPITKAEYDQLKEIQKNYPNLTFQNEGYTYPKKSEWSEEDMKAFNTVTDILSKSVKGFSSFNHFVLNKEGKVQIRLQYNYGYDGGLSFVGVGYLLLSELFMGFGTEKLDQLNPVVFLYNEKNEDLYAYFPDIEFDSQGNKQAYNHIGQHSSASIEYVNESRLATPEEYKDLAAELKSIGYAISILDDLDILMTEYKIAVGL